MDPTEYAISKPVRNRPIVREVDETRHRQHLRWILIALVLVVLGVLATWQHLQVIQYGYRLERLRQERAEQEEIGRHLRLEIEQLRSPKVIERLAIERLHMIPPPRGQAVVIERIAPSAPPPASIVAAR